MYFFNLTSNLVTNGYLKSYKQFKKKYDSLVEKIFNLYFCNQRGTINVCNL